MKKISKRLDSKIKMFKATVSLYLSKQARFDVVTAFPAAMTTFQNRNAEIDNLVVLATEDTKPITQQRDALRPPLYLSAAVVARAICGYADSIGNLVLKGTMNWTEAKLDKLPLDQLGPQCDSIHEEGVLLLVEAGPHGLDQSKLDKLEDDNTAWKAMESGTRNKLVAISQAKRQLAKLIKDNMGLLTGQMNNMVFTLSESDPELVTIWEQTTSPVAFPSTTTQVQVLVKDKLSNLFIYEAEVELVNGVVNRAVTNIEGEAIYKPLKHGYYNVLVTALGYKRFELLQVRIYKGRINRLEVILEPED
ncbi:MAG: hypothetical protein GC192_20365 [Bacteroidetes bacterium]|nr:hypothetical protein [Bacteroidota bacterium]